MLALPVAHWADDTTTVQGSLGMQWTRQDQCRHDDIRNINSTPDKPKVFCTEFVVETFLRIYF